MDPILPRVNVEFWAIMIIYDEIRLPDYFFFYCLLLEYTKKVTGSVFNWQKKQLNLKSLKKSNVQY